MRAVIEKETALIMQEASLLMHKYIYVRQLFQSYKRLALFTRDLTLLSCSLQSKECQNKPTSIAKVRQTCQEYPDEFSATLVGDLRCNLCDVLVKCDKKFFVESHRKSKQHQGKLETKSKPQSKQTFLHFYQVNFTEQVSSFLAADIPLHKLNHPSLKSLFARMGKVLPSETAARACVAKLASQKEEQIQELLRDKKVFLIVDEAEVAKQKYISVLVGSLDAPDQTFLVNCHPLDSGRNVNSSIILYTVDDILRQLKIKRENFSSF